MDQVVYRANNGQTPKRQIRTKPYKAEKNSVQATNIGVKNNQYTGSKSRRKTAVKKAKMRFASLGMAAIVGLGAIGIMANQANNAMREKNTQKAITEARAINNSITEYVNSNNIAMQAVVSVEETVQLQNLAGAITTYKELEYKKDKTLNEQQQYIDACKTICSSKQLVADSYKDIIRAKVAEAYEITNLQYINSIDVHNNKDTRNEMTNNPVIELSDGRAINDKGKFMNSNNTMDKTLANAIIEAEELENIKFSFNEDALEELPINEIIETLEKAMNFKASYKLVADKDGNLQSIEIQNEKTHNRPAKDNVAIEQDQEPEL